MTKRPQAYCRRHREKFARARRPRAIVPLPHDGRQHGDAASNVRPRDEAPRW
ncbi:hypothetical protein D6C78_11079 [Aureobasidium pullulans]|uniref:Uncharacterized protein n=1 Tax=Aureobasidium pullulans TaxID=5580 RepID=A0A4T0B785_AURPU|nr:hypothetical protein D6D27_10455 [Aureobasidium pullulans]TIA27384.1 hypothetical protein D6C78_11079 [Aureobasidium pullulans]